MPPRRSLNAIQSLYIPLALRFVLLRWMGCEVGAAARIEERCFFRGQVSIGARTYVGVGCFFDGGEITVGARCSIAHRVNIVTSTHEFGSEAERAGPRFVAPVVIGDGCWIGSEATILPGVVIAPGCIVAARALVTKSTEPNGLYVGAPAVRVRDLPAGA